MSKQEVILCKELENDLTHAIGKCPHDKLFILTDEHTHRLCLPQLQSIPALENAAEIIIGAEDVHKNLETLASVWQALSEQGATRHSLLINLFLQLLKVPLMQLKKKLIHILIIRIILIM